MLGRRVGIFFCHTPHLPTWLAYTPIPPRSPSLLLSVQAFMKDIVAVDMDNTLCDVALQGFNTLTEFCQGPCQLNQAALLQCNVCHEVNIVFHMQKNNADDVGQLDFDLQSAAVVMLLSLLEGSTDNSGTDVMVKTLDFEAMHGTLNAMWKSVRDGVTEGGLVPLSDSQEETLDLTFNLYVLLFRLCRLPVAAGPSGRQALAYFRSVLCTIEIAREDTVEKVYFRKPTICNMLMPAAKDEVL